MCKISRVEQLLYYELDDTTSSLPSKTWSLLATRKRKHWTTTSPKTTAKWPTYMSRRVHDELPLDGPHPVLLVLRVQLVSGDHEGVHVVDGTAGGEDAVPGLESDQLPHLGQALVFHQDEDGCDLVGEHVGVCRRRQPFSGQGDDVQAGRELVEEVGMTYNKAKLSALI